VAILLRSNFPLGKAVLQKIVMESKQGYNLFHGPQMKEVVKHRGLSCLIFTPS
jgi:hypothetical protein